MTRPSKHKPLTKSYAIDQIEDIEQLRAVAHRMWEAFFASHWQTSHLINVMVGECKPCMDALNNSDSEAACEEWKRRQAKVSDGFGSV